MPLLGSYTMPGVVVVVDVAPRWGDVVAAAVAALFAGSPVCRRLNTVRCD